MGLEISLIFAFGAMLCWGFGDFFIQRSTRKIGDLESLALIGVIGSIGLLPFIIKDFSLLFSAQNILILAALGVITFICAIFNFEALKKGKLSIVEVVLEAELPITIALGFVFFQERLSVLQMLIILFILCGIVLIATKSFNHWKAKLEKGVLIAFIAALLMGVVNFLTASSSKKISPLMAVWVPWVIFTVICLVVIIRREGFNTFISNTKKFHYLVIAMGTFDTLAWLFYSFAVVQKDISIITAITESYPAVALFLGLWFNKEKIGWHQYTGAFVALSASFILAITS